MYMLNFKTLGCPLMYSLKLQRLGMADRKILNFYFQVTCCFLAEILVLFFSDAFFTSCGAAESCSGVCCCSWEDLFTYVWMTVNLLVILRMVLGFSMYKIML